MLLNYFVFIALRDSVIIMYEFIFGDFMGFWKAVSLQIINVPLDCFVLLILTTSSAISLSQERTLECRMNEDCSPFLSPARGMVVLGFAYICFNIGVKLCLFAFFMFALGGFDMLLEDLDERARHHNAKAGNRAYRSL